MRARNNPDTAPLMVWMDGGPGCAGTFGLFFNIGPFTVKDYHVDPKTGIPSGVKKADLRELSWTKNYNILFPDNPIGVGFSTNSDDEYFPLDREQATKQFTTFYLNFLKKYPEFKKRPLYFTGASFGGHWAPYFASGLDNLGNPDINIQGLVIASGFLNSKELYQSYPKFSEENKEYTKITPEVLTKSQ